MRITINEKTVINDPDGGSASTTMVRFVKEVRRVLRSDGTLFLNIGDSYAGSWGAMSHDIKGKAKRAGTNSHPVTSYDSNARRVNACDIDGKAPEDSINHGCLCQNLCDACRVAYQIGKSHSDSRLAPMPFVSPCDSTLESKESHCDHLPTSGSRDREAHNVIATPDSVQTEDHDGGPLRVSSSSMTFESFSQHRGDSRQSGNSSACRLCNATLRHDAQASDHRSACTCGTQSTSGPLVSRRSGMVSSGLAYGYLTNTSPKSKDLVGIPWLLAFALRADGWYLRSDIIWSKPNPMPESVKDRPTKSHEYIFLLTRSDRYYYNQDAIAEDCVGTEYDKTKRPKGRMTGAPSLVDGRGQEVAGGSLGCGSEKRNCRSVWRIPTVPYAEAHFATFPEELARRCILAGSKPSDTILDPFFGAGTTGLVSQKNLRQWIGIELNAKYVEIAERRIARLGML